MVGEGLAVYHFLPEAYLPFPFPILPSLQSALPELGQNSLLWLSIVYIERYGIMITFSFFWFFLG